MSDNIITVAGGVATCTKPCTTIFDDTNTKAFRLKDGTVVCGKAHRDGDIDDSGMLSLIECASCGMGVGKEVK